MEGEGGKKRALNGTQFAVMIADIHVSLGHTVADIWSSSMRERQ